MQPIMFLLFAVDDRELGDNDFTASSALDLLNYCAFCLLQMESGLC